MSGEADLECNSPLPTSLPSTIVPSPSQPRELCRRLIIIGDIHGHLPAFRSLLIALKINPDHPSPHDHIILAGDLVNKGFHSPDVVDLARRLGVSAVRGNHDDAVLRRAAVFGLKEQGKDIVGGLDLEDEASKTALALGEDRLCWLSGLPLILRVDNCANASAPPPWNAGTLVVVHGGLVPGVPLEEQDAQAVMTTRTLDYPSEQGGKPVPSKAHNGDLPWSVGWSIAQGRLPDARDRTVVVFGHDAKARLQVDDPLIWTGKVPELVRGGKLADGAPMEARRYAFGLDTGTVHGGQLTALVLERNVERRLEHRLVQVDCEMESEPKG